MKGKKKPTLPEDKTIKDPFERMLKSFTLEGAIGFLLDEYARQTGTILTALLYRPQAFTEDGQLKYPQIPIKEEIANKITRVIAARTEHAEQARLDRDLKLAKEGIILSA